MRVCLIFLTALACTFNIVGAQGYVALADTTPNLTILQSIKANAGSERPPHYLVRGNVTFLVPESVLIGKILEVADLEVQECTAVLKGDTVRLAMIWARDFMLDQGLNKLVTGKNTLPRFVSFSRVVERMSVVGDAVHTSGYEFVTPFTADTKIPPATRRVFFHTWARQNGHWKLLMMMHRE